MSTSRNNKPTNNPIYTKRMCSVWFWFWFSSLFFESRWRAHHLGLRGKIARHRAIRSDSCEPIESHIDEYRTGIEQCQTVEDDFVCERPTNQQSQRQRKGCGAIARERTSLARRLMLGRAERACACQTDANRANCSGRLSVTYAEHQPASLGRQSLTTPQKTQNSTISRRKSAGF
jgi:hypothetical protein